MSRRGTTRPLIPPLHSDLHLSWQSEQSTEQSPFYAAAVITVTTVTVVTTGPPFLRRARAPHLVAETGNRHVPWGAPARVRLGRATLFRSTQDESRPPGPRRPPARPSPALLAAGEAEAAGEGPRDLWSHFHFSVVSSPVISEGVSLGLSAGSNSNISVACGLAYSLPVSCTLTFDQTPHQSCLLPPSRVYFFCVGNGALRSRTVSFLTLPRPLRGTHACPNLCRSPLVSQRLAPTVSTRRRSCIKR